MISKFLIFSILSLLIILILTYINKIFNIQHFYQEFDDETNYDNYFQGGFCKYQEKLGYDVGCSLQNYDDAFFNVDRELNSVKQNYSILTSNREPTVSSNDNITTSTIIN
jgi:hypothetical protein